MKINFFLSDIQIEGMTGNNIRQQLKKLTDAGKVNVLTKVSIIKILPMSFHSKFLQFLL